MTILLFVLFCLLQCGDVYTTLWCLTHGGSEANPVMAYIFKKITPLGGLLLAKSVAAVALGIGTFSGVFPLMYYPVVLLGYAYVVYNNVKVMKALKAAQAK